MSSKSPSLLSEDKMKSPTQNNTNSNDISESNEDVSPSLSQEFFSPMVHPSDVFHQTFSPPKMTTPSSPLFFPSTAFESVGPSRARIRNGVRKSVLIDYDTKLEDDNIPCLKLLLLGSAGVGKSALLIRYADDYFDEFNATNTIGIDLKMKLVDVDSKLFKVVLWDTAGQERFRNITPSLYKDTHGILLVYDVNNRKSFEELDHWINECIENSRDNLRNVVFFVVGNKRDKPMDERQVFIPDLQKFSEKVKLQYKAKGVNIAGYYEVSAKYHVDVKFLFRTFISECVRSSLAAVDEAAEEEAQEANTSVDLTKGKTLIKTYSCC